MALLDIPCSFRKRLCWRSDADTTTPYAFPFTCGRHNNYATLCHAMLYHSMLHMLHDELTILLSYFCSVNDR